MVAVNRLKLLIEACFECSEPVKFEFDFKFGYNVPLLSFREELAPVYDC